MTDETRDEKVQDQTAKPERMEDAEAEKVVGGLVGVQGEPTGWNEVPMNPVPHPGAEAGEGGG